MKRLLACLLLNLSALAGSAAALNPGDIAFTGFNADGNDDLAFVTLVELPAATEIFFTDNEWSGTDFVDGNEGVVGWEATSVVPAGTVVVLTDVNSSSRIANTGTLTSVDGTFDISASNEALFAYEGTGSSDANGVPIPANFVAMIANEDLAGAETTLTGTGLSEAAGTAIIFTSDEDGMRYTGARVGQATFAGYLPLIADRVTNWETEASNGEVFLPFNTTPFTSAASSEVGIVDASVTEGDSGSGVLEFTVSRTDPASEFSVEVAVTGGTAVVVSDYVNPGPATLTFTAAGANTQTFSVTVNGDTELEIDETVIVTLSNVVNTTGTTTISSVSATGTIANDDFLPVTYPPSNKVRFSQSGSIAERSPGVPLAGAEIPAFDAASKRAFLSSGSGVEVIDLTNPAAPVFVKNLDLTAAPYNLASNDVSSVTVKDGVLAAAVIATPKTANGTVIFIDAASEALLGTVPVGSVPDHVGFTPDGMKVLVAIEGELADLVSEDPRVADSNGDPATDTIPGGVAIIDVSGGFGSASVTTADFTAFDSQTAALRAAGVRIFAGGKPSTDFEPEYFAVSADGTTAMVTLQEANAVAVLNIGTATFTSVHALGQKDFSGLMADFSDRDGAGASNLIKPTTGNPVFGLYMPDQIASFESNGQLYFITANEGDDRDDFLPTAEAARVMDAGYDLDDTAFPNEVALKESANLGRLTVSNAPGLRGDTDVAPDGDVDQILAYGARSFSIWDASGSLVYDSGDMLEMIVASQFPASFDDSRSDNKGPEPEGVTVMEVDGSVLALVGLERSNMVLVFDVTNPMAPTYVTDLQHAGDVSPEGMVVVSATDSPSGYPLVLVANEVSNSLSVYQLNPKLIITEVQSAQAVSGAGDYWELTNAGDTTVDLSGWSWDDDSVAAGTVPIPNGTTIAPGESVIFTAVAAATFRTRWNLAPSVQVITGAGAPGLGGGDGVYLFDAADVLITSFNFAAGNFTKVDGSPSLGGHAGVSAGGTLDSQAAVLDPFYGTANPRYTFADGTTLGTFESTASSSELGSPGAAFLEPQLLVTELNSSGAPADFWELTNVGVATVDLSGWSWDDDSDTPGTVVIPDGTSIAAGESVIFTSADPAAFRTLWGLAGAVQVINGTGSVPGFGGSGDRVTLYDASDSAVASFSYFPGGFTLSSGSLSTLTAHAGPAAGGSADGQSVILDPSFGTETPRYTFADGSALGTSNPSGSVTGSPGAANLGITSGTVEIADASVAEGDSGTTLLTLTVTRSTTDTAFSVDYAVTGGTASSGVDFDPLASGTLNFLAAGAATANISITINGDVDPEPDETIIVTLSNVVDTTGTTILATAEGTGTIINDDAIAPTITREPTATTIASGGVTTLRVAADGFPAPTFQWYQGVSGDDSTPVGTVTSATTFVTPTLTATTSFWVRASNTAGGDDSATATVTVVPAITSVDLSQYVRVGRYDLPEPTRTSLPPGTPAHNLLCQEASAVTYNWDTDTLFITGDGGRSITQVSKTGELIDTMTLALGSSPQGTDFYDPEGLTYVGGGQFVMSEERDRNLVKFTYVAGTTLSRAGAQTVNIGPFVDNTGTEGLTFDPVTGGFICLKEISPIGIFQTDVDFGLGTATNKATGGSESTNLFDPALLGMSDVADVFALANLPGMGGQAQEPFLLVIGQENARVVNVDRSGNIQSTLQIVTDVGNPLSAGNQQHEGVTMDPAGNLYVVNENGGGDADHPQLWVYAPATAPNAAPTQVVLNNPVNDINENTSTASPIKVGEIVVVDDGLGTNDLSLSGADVAFFEIVGAELFLKAGTVLDFETKASYSLVIEADDTTVGNTPDATLNYSLSVNDLEPETPPAPALIISEVAPWSSGDSPVGGDWFEVTNTTDNPIDITGWKVDDGSATFANAATLNGVTTIAAGESVIFIETSDLPTISATFLSNWFGASPPVGLQIGSYSGSGLGLSSNGDGLNLFNAAGVLQASITFGASPGAAPFTTFDNTVGLNNAEIAQFSSVGVNGAFVAANSANEIGSPGFAAPGELRITEVAPWSSGNSPVVGADWFEVTNLGARAVDIRGWKVDDASESPASAVALVGVDTIAPGESVIFIESSTPTTTIADFISNWFGGVKPNSLQIGTYTGSGVGLSTGGDAVNLYDTRAPTPARRASVNFGASPNSAPFATFDNSAGLDVATISQLSVVGVNGAYAVAAGNEIGSPGAIQVAPASANFPQSVASGDPRSDSVILWTRLVDGNTSLDRPVTLHLTTTGSVGDVGSNTVLGGSNLWAGGTLTAQAAHDGVVKVKVAGLAADTTYYYQFSYLGQRSPIGRTKTAPAANSTREIKYAAINCNDFVGRYFNVLRHLAESEVNNIDFVLNLGDYIYETTGDPSFQTTTPERAMVFSNPGEAIDLGGGNLAAQSVGNYRDIYKTIRQDPQLQRVHELFPMISIWDDHEFSDDNWKDNATYFDGRVNEQQTSRKQNGEQVWMEFLPTERGLATSGAGLEIDGADLYPNTVIYDAFNFGKNLDLILTDIRTNRVDHLIPEDACPSGIPMAEADVIATLAAANGLDVPTFTGAVWPGIRGNFAPYVDIDDPAYVAVKAGFKAIIAASVNNAMAALPTGQTPITTGAAYADANVVGLRDASFINQAFVAAGQSAPFDSAALAAMPRGLSYYILGKTSVFSDFGSRYQVVNQTFQLYAGYTYQAFVLSGGALGRDQAFYDTAQQAFLATALGNSTAAGNKWRVVASSTPFTPIKLELGDLPAGVTLPTSGLLNGSPVPAGLPPEFLVEFLLNADEPAGFPQFRQGIVDLLAGHDAIIVSGDIHAQLVGENTATNGQKVVDFTVPSAASGEFRRAVSGAFSLVEGLVGASLGGAFTYDATQKQAVIDATDAIIEHNTPEMFKADTETHGYTVFRAGGSSFDAEYHKISVDEISNNLYAETPMDLANRFSTELFSVSTTGAGAASDLTLDQVDFSLQILHASDLEGGVEAIPNAPGFAAMVDALEAAAGSGGTASILLSAGDNYLPGPFFNAAANSSFGPLFNSTYNTLFGETRYNDLRAEAGRADITIMNILGFDASAVGNHEFDDTSEGMRVIIEEEFRNPLGPASDRWVGAQFPYLSANIDFSADTSLAALFTPSILPNTAFVTGPVESDAGNGNVPKLASATTIEVNGKLVGVVGATTQVLTTISSPSGAVGKTPVANDMPALAAVLQPVIDDVRNGDDNVFGNTDDVDVVVLVTHLQQIALEKALAPLLSGVDVIIAGGSDTLQANPGTYLRAGDVAAEGYPFFATNAESEPVAIVSTAGEYSYLGRLVAGFNANGVLIATTVDPMVSGPYATDETGVTAITGAASLTDAVAASSKATAVKTLTDAVNSVIIAKDGDIKGYTDVYIEGRRLLVRTEETTMGNVTADANLVAAQAIDPTVAVSIKNGGGIRASIGAIDGITGDLLPPAANALAGKPAGAISQLDLENVMRFNNKLMVFETTPAGLLALIEHGVAAVAPGATPGQFAQVGGMAFSFDPGLPAGSRVRSLAIVDGTGAAVDRVVQNGVVLGNPARVIKAVTLNFLANGGDTYPFKAVGENFRFILDNGTLGPVIAETENFTSALIVPVNAMGEQGAAAAYFAANHATPATAYDTLDTAKALDTRIQFIGVRTDNVLEGAPLAFNDWLAANGYTSAGLGEDSDGNGVSDAAEYFFDQSPNDPSDLGNLPAMVQNGADLELRFTRLANTPDLTGVLRYSTTLGQWFDATEGVDYEVISETVIGDVIEARYRILKGNNDFKFFQMELVSIP